MEPYTSEAALTQMKMAVLGTMPWSFTGMRYGRDAGSAGCGSSIVHDGVSLLVALLTFSCCIHLAVLLGLHCAHP